MNVALTLIGVLVAALGVVAIGFGIPINEFSLGNTLIISGTTALTGGLILIALAAALRQLTRIADALTRPMPRPQRPAEPAEGAGARPPPPPPRVPFPPKPPSREPVAAEPRAPEPPRPVPPAIEDRPRPRIPPLPAGGAPGEFEEPVAPSVAAPFPPPPVTPVAPAVPGPSRESAWADEVRPARADEGRGARTDEGRGARGEEVRAVGSATVDVLRGPRLEPPWRPTLPTEREPAGGPERTRGLFDSLWPVDRDRKGGEARKSEPAEPRERRTEDTPAATDLGMAAVGEALAKAGPEPVEPEAPAARAERDSAETAPAEADVEAPAPAAEPAAAAEPPRDDAEPAPAHPGPGPAEDHRPVTILKSGVVDGMAYTLYSDGSIEAELPEGTIRFTSIEDLRRHLDTHS